MRQRGLLPFSLYPRPQTTEGHDTTQTSAGSFTRLTGRIRLVKPLSLEAVLWDINTAGNYTLELVDSLAASPAVLDTIATSVALSGSGAENTIIVSPPRLLFPGDHYLSLLASSAVAWRRNGTNVVHFDNFSYLSIGYDGGSTTTGSIPVKLVGCYYEFMRANQFRR